MKRAFYFILSLSAFIFLSTTTVFSQCSSEVKAQKISNHDELTKDVVDIAIGSEAHTTLVAAVKAAGLVETLKSEGPFTIFAPTNAAFDKLPEGTVANLIKPENKDQLTSILTYHVIAGNFEAADVVKAAQDKGGSFDISTIQGGKLKVMLKEGEVWLIDENGNYSKIIATDLKATNGVVHVVDTVVLPK
jgi:uncharacterized surface protein with fasciclin (FAS1) repeats